MRNRIINWLILSSTCFVVCACGSPASETPQPSVPASGSKQPAATSSTAAPAPLAPSAYRVEWSNHQIPSEMQAGKGQAVTLTLKNVGDATWPSKGTGGGPVNQVLISYHWLPMQGEKAVVWDGIRTALPHDVAPGETITVNNVQVYTPNEPGTYRLQLTLLQEGVTWFESRGANTLTVPMTVR